MLVNRSDASSQMPVQLLCVMIHVSLIFSNRTFRLWRVTNSLDLLGLWSQPFILPPLQLGFPLLLLASGESELLQASSKKVTQQRLKLSSLPPRLLQREEEPSVNRKHVPESYT